jgi:hypothetical protein
MLQSIITSVLILYNFMRDVTEIFLCSFFCSKLISVALIYTYSTYSRNRGMGYPKQSSVIYHMGKRRPAGSMILSFRHTTCACAWTDTVFKPKQIVETKTSFLNKMFCILELETDS